MRLPGRHVALFLILVLVPSILTASTRSRSKKKTKDTKEKQVNVCEIDEQGASLYCYCNSNDLRNATEANCLIFGRLEPEQPIWNHFSSQPYLKKLTLIVRHDGNFSHIPTTAIKQLKDIETIMIQYANISVVPERAFSNISTVVEINLSRNRIENLTRYAFENMKNLTHVNLDDNRIAEIYRDVFINLPNLRKLFINKNNLTTVHDKAFKHLTHLEELELSGNEISVLTRDTFYGLKSLVRLDLRDNHLGMIGDKTFIEMRELQEIDLDQNQIEFISGIALEGMTSLRKLRLSENKLVTLEPDFLAGAPNVYLLDLRDNMLKTMTFDNIKPIVTNLYNSSSYFYLEGNKLTCDCRLAWIWGLRNETNNTRLKESLEELTCFLETNNATTRQSTDNTQDEKQSQALALEVPQNQEEYVADNMGDYPVSPDEYLQGDEAEAYYDYEDDPGESVSNSNAQPTFAVVEGKTGYVRHLFQLKVEELPCPDGQDLMASEQPSSHQEATLVGSSSGSMFSISSSSETPSLSHFALLILSLTNLAILFT